MPRSLTSQCWYACPESCMLTQAKGSTAWHRHKNNTQTQRSYILSKGSKALSEMGPYGLRVSQSVAHLPYLVIQCRRDLSSTVLQAGYAWPQRRPLLQLPAGQKVQRRVSRRVVGCISAGVECSAPCLCRLASLLHQCTARLHSDSAPVQCTARLPPSALLHFIAEPTCV